MMSVEAKSRAPDGMGSTTKQVDANKQPPPENPEAIRTKTLVIFSFWAVVIFLGLPIWWWTTSIHRANLPTAEMLDWSDGKTCSLDFPLWIDVQAPVLTSTEVRGIIGDVDEALATSNNIIARGIQWNITTTSDRSQDTRDEEVALHIRFREGTGLSVPTATFLPQSTVLEVLYDLKTMRSNYETASRVLVGLLVEKLQEAFAEGQSSVANVLASNPGYNQQLQATGGGSIAISPELTAKLARKRSRALKYAPKYHISISLFTPGAEPTSWEIDEAVSEYLEPLLKSFSISNFTVDTQLQLYAPFSPAMRAPEFDSGKKQWLLREEDLSSFVNAAEWPLSPNIGDGPTLNFILYIPAESTTPLAIGGSGATSWIVPQWGGVSILNPTKRIQGRLSKEQIQPAILTFSRQLLSLLGAPDTPSSFPLQLQTLTRLHALSLMLSASSTLGSLARLSESLSTIPIPEEVLLRVRRGLGHLQETCNNLQSGKSLKALEHARLAEAEAEKAFFEKDMVSQVYFPDEHKVAVYLPMLGPIGFTLLASFFREIRRRRTAKKA